jgi:hypothetical protein
MSVLAVLGYVSRDFPRWALARAVLGLAARRRRPITVGIEHRLRMEMATVIGRVAYDVKTFRKRSDRRRLAAQSAGFAVRVYRNIVTGGPLIPGTAEALLSALYFVNAELVDLPRPDEAQVVKYAPAALAAITDRNEERGSRNLAAALRAMYRLRTVRELAPLRWVLSAVGV